MAVRLLQHGCPEHIIRLAHLGRIPNLVVANIPSAVSITAAYATRPASPAAHRTATTPIAATNARSFSATYGATALSTAATSATTEPTTSYAAAAAVTPASFIATSSPPTISKPISTPFAPTTTADIAGALSSTVPLTCDAS
jgi:hypothetical protein